ncbi:adenylate/guanylate cyclase catalytic domain protein [Ancylostoma ceylanicum]|uniref:Adenylate/guanylate cyclase catalytic domain protein n=1 Tax=Ancylostoma ceylanicum TaxID=53326 RepID=A0A0D6LF62_9BILA|nr:adenylate/guanylate cyclase catalytic domain protein [Ancylostoma ceylanicum]
MPRDLFPWSTVVNLLNELYGSFDAIIEEHDVYKVESIGDGYLCVSGLPARNGHQHIKKIIEMSVRLMKYVENFRIASLPLERIQLRIGINSGKRCHGNLLGSWQTWNAFKKKIQ